jgi:chorismate--pyruvate lyase
VPNSAWATFAEIEARAPAALLSWLAEPGLLTARVRELCGASMQFRMLGPLRTAPVPESLRVRLAVADADCLLREIEFCQDAERIIFAQTIIPATTVATFPWLRALGEAPLGEALRAADLPLERDPLEYRSLSSDHPLARAAVVRSRPLEGVDVPGDVAASLWARRAVYRLAAHPILVQEVFLPSLLRVQGSTQGAMSQSNQPAQAGCKVHR